MSKKFIKKQEDFICAVCKTYVKGDGYTNHCSNCLYSKHVDVHPGDRAENCQGLMKPIRIDGDNIEKMDVIQKCDKCSIERRNRLCREDNMEAVLKLAKDFAKKKVDEWKSETTDISTRRKGGNANNTKNTNNMDNADDQGVRRGGL